MLILVIFGGPPLVAVPSKCFPQTALPDRQSDHDQAIEEDTLILFQSGHVLQIFSILGYSGPGHREGQTFETFPIWTFFAARCFQCREYLLLKLFSTKYSAGIFFTLCSFTTTTSMCLELSLILCYC